MADLGFSLYSMLCPYIGNHPVQLFLEHLTHQAIPVGAFTSKDTSHEAILEDVQNAEVVPKGLSHVDRVIQGVFRYLGKIRWDQDSVLFLFVLHLMKEF